MPPTLIAQYRGVYGEIHSWMAVGRGWYVDGRTRRIATKRWRRLLITHGPRYSEWTVQRKHWPNA